MNIKIVLDKRLLDDKDLDFFHYEQSYPLAKCSKGTWYIASRGELQCDYYNDNGEWEEDALDTIQSCYVRNNDEFYKAIDNNNLQFDCNNWLEIEFYDNNGCYDEDNYFTDEIYGSIGDAYRDFINYVKKGDK